MFLHEKHFEFSQLVEDYCDSIEKPSVSPRESLGLIQETLGKLYLHAVKLQMPDAKDMSFEDLPETLTVNDQKNIEEILVSCIRNDLFWHVYHPFTTPAEEPVCSSLSSDLAEIWWDLKPGLLALKADRTRAPDIFWDWKFSFDTHWGDHAVDSIWAIHKLLRDASF